jgi:predicted type IV restriction endonuclease
MAAIPKRVIDRLVVAVKKFQPILAASKARDDGEADTSTIVKDLLAEVFGYDKFAEVTAEHGIRGSYCDLAIKLDNKIESLIEVKAIGLELKDQHVKQAVDYAANQGVNFVVLTNGIHWRIYSVTFAKPIDHELVIDIDFSTLKPKDKEDGLQCLYLFCKEGWVKSVLNDYQTQKEALSRFFLGALILSDHVLEVIRRELRRVSPDVKIELEQIKTVLCDEVLKREVIDGDQADVARKKIARSANKSLRKTSNQDDDDTPCADDLLKLPKAKSAS